MVFDLRVLQQHASLESDTVADDAAGADDHVGADAAALADLRGRVDHDVAAKDVGFVVGDEGLGLVLGQGGQVQAGAAQEVLGLAHVHPEALEVERVELVVLADGREGLLLDRGGPQLDALEDRRVEDVDARVDPVADELDRLLDEPVDAGGVAGLVDDDAVLAGLLDLGHDDGALVPVGGVEVGQLPEGVLADDVRVEDEERLVVPAEDLLGELQGARGAQGFGLDRERDLDVVPLLVLLQGPGHDLRAIVNRQDNVRDAGGRQGLDLVQDHGSVGELDEGFREGEGERSQSGAEATDAVVPPMSCQ